MTRTILLALVFGCLAVVPASGASAGTTGNGAPNGSHYTLNIIGVPHDKTADMNNNNGGRIFVRLTFGDTPGDLNGKTLSQFNHVNKIFLVQAPVGESFETLTLRSFDTQALPVESKTMNSG